MKPAPQRDLPVLADLRQRGLLVAGPDMAVTLNRLREDGAQVESLKTLHRENGCWRVRVHWPACTANARPGNAGK
ncbi:MAG: hypothetical protein ACYDH9_13965 [Limisphaerales bacterium]